MNVASRLPSRARFTSDLIKMTFTFKAADSALTMKGQTHNLNYNVQNKLVIGPGCIPGPVERLFASSAAWISLH